jgi:hypothetical protein
MAIIGRQKKHRGDLSDVQKKCLFSASDMPVVQFLQRRNGHHRERFAVMGVEVNFSP